MRNTENRFERDIQRFEEQDKNDLPRKDAVLFVGSSSFTLWRTLEQDFGGIEVINRGFGGALFSDVIHFAHRIVISYLPRIIVVCAGSRDLHSNGAGSEDGLRLFKTFRKMVRAELPEVKICYVSMKPSITKWETIHLDEEANRLIEEYADKTPGVEFIDIWLPMFAESSPPPKEYFQPDLNHPSHAGYTLWAKVIRPFIEWRIANMEWRNRPFHRGAS